MPTCNGGITRTDLSANQPSGVPPTPPLPPWLCHSDSRSSPSVTLSLSTSAIIHTTPESPWLRPHNHLPNRSLHSNSAAHIGTEILHELEESRQLLEAHKKEAAWRMRRVEQLLESEKASRKRQKVEEIEAQIKAVKEEEKVSLERIEMEYREQLADLARESEAKEHKLTEQWASKHLRLASCLQHVNNGVWMPESNPRRM